MYSALLGLTLALGASAQSSSKSAVSRSRSSGSASASGASSNIIGTPSNSASLPSLSGASSIVDAFADEMNAGGCSDKLLGDGSERRRMRDRCGGGFLSPTAFFYPAPKNTQPSFCPASPPVPPPPASPLLERPQALVAWDRRLLASRSARHLVLLISGFLSTSAYLPSFDPSKNNNEHIRSERGDSVTAARERGRVGVCTAYKPSEDAVCERKEREKRAREAAVAGEWYGEGLEGENGAGDGDKSGFCNGEGGEVNGRDAEEEGKGGEDGARFEYGAGDTPRAADCAAPRLRGGRGGDVCAGGGRAAPGGDVWEMYLNEILRAGADKAALARSGTLPHALLRGLPKPGEEINVPYTAFCFLVRRLTRYPDVACSLGYTPSTSSILRQRGGFETGDIPWFPEGGLNASYNCDADELGEGCSVTYAQLLREVCGLANVLQTTFSRDSFRRLCGLLRRIAEGPRQRLCKPGAHYERRGKAGREGDCDESDCRCGVEGVSGLSRAEALRRGGIGGGMTQRSRGILPADDHAPEVPLFILCTSGSTGKPKGVVHTTAGYLLCAALTVKYVFDVHAHDGQGDTGKVDVFACMVDVGWITGHTGGDGGGGGECRSPSKEAPRAGAFEEPAEARLRTTRVRSSTSGTQSLGSAMVRPAVPDASCSLSVCRRLRPGVSERGFTHRLGPHHVAPHDLSSLRVLGSAGEPINPEAWNWYNEHVGHGQCAVVDTFWMGEDALSLPFLPSLRLRKANGDGFNRYHALPGRGAHQARQRDGAFFGHVPVILDAFSGEELKGNSVEGVLALASPWPSVARTIWQEHARYICQPGKTTYMCPYLPLFYTGDGEGYIWIRGRVDGGFLLLSVLAFLEGGDDACAPALSQTGRARNGTLPFSFFSLYLLHDVINTAEIESALIMHNGVPETAGACLHPRPPGKRGSCQVDSNWDGGRLTGQAVYAFVTVKPARFESVLVQSPSEAAQIKPTEVGIQDIKKILGVNGWVLNENGPESKIPLMGSRNSMHPIFEPTDSPEDVRVSWGSIYNASAQFSGGKTAVERRRQGHA
ncbi:hypothetical protein C8R47DRAFT_1077574 [Mycena vitilis]|nr:hypothetical protein C8R47DRAFT_1077574 [Mycena vitilis]